MNLSSDVQVATFKLFLHLHCLGIADLLADQLELVEYLQKVLDLRLVQKSHDLTVDIFAFILDFC